MAQLPTSFSAPHSNISDGSDLIRAAMGLNRDINEFGNKAFSTVSKFATQQANQALANTFASNIANGMDPTAAMSGALGKVNSWTSAESINNLLTQRNFEKEALRKEALLDINKAQERRAMQNWLGENEAAEANLLLDTGYNTNNSSIFNQGLSKASELSDRAKKYVKMHNLAKQQDDFASSATSRGYTKAMTDQIADKKLASRLDADFKMIKAQNPHMSNIQVAQKVGTMNGMSTENVTRQLIMHEKASGQATLKEQASYLSPMLTDDTRKNYEKAKQNNDTFGIDINAAIEGKTDQNKKDIQVAINTLSEELTSIIGEDPELKEYNERGVEIGPSPVKLPKTKTTELITGLLENPTPEKLKEVNKYLESIDTSGKLVDWLNSNFTVENNKVTFAPKTAEGINKALGMQPMNNADGKSRQAMLDADKVTMQRLGLSFIDEQQKNIYGEISKLTSKAEKELTDEEKAKLDNLNINLNNLTFEKGKQAFKTATATDAQNPIDSLNKTINTYGDLIDSGKHIQKQDLIDRKMDPDLAKDVIKRIKSVKETALSNEKYKNISEEAIELAVLDNPDDAGGWFYFDTDYLKKAATIDLEKYSKKGQSKLQQQARGILNNSYGTIAQMYIKGYGTINYNTATGDIIDNMGNVIGNINNIGIGTN